MTDSASLYTALAAARSFLFVPGNRPERYAKALDAGADAVVLDLEDAVPLADKARAREAIGAALPALVARGTPLVVRLNALTCDLGREDLAWLAGPAGRAVPFAVMVPKAESGSTPPALADRPLIPLIESAAGWAALAEVAAAPGVVRLAVGHIDFMADTGIQCSDDEAELLPLRFTVTMQTRLHRLAPAIDGVTARFDDDERLRRDTRRALAMGFGAKLCIHPRQIAVVHAALAPSAEEVAWAERVVAADRAAAGAAVQLDGRMVDAPVVAQARRVLRRQQIQGRV